MTNRRILFYLQLPPTSLFIFSHGNPHLWSHLPGRRLPGLRRPDIVQLLNQAVVGGMPRTKQVEAP